MSQYNSTGAFDIVTPVPVTIADGHARKLFWSVAGSSSPFIARANLDGSGFEVLQSGLQSPSAVFMEELRQRLYWVDYDGSSNYRLNFRAWFSSGAHQWGGSNDAATAVPSTPTRTTRGPFESSQ